MVAFSPYNVYAQLLFLPMNALEKLDEWGPDIAFKGGLAEEVVRFGTEVYRRLLMNESFQGMEHETLGRIRQVTEDAFSLKTEVTGEVRPCNDDERMVWIGNHPLYETQWLTIEAMVQLAENGCGIGKSELLWNPVYLPPFLAWPAKLSGKGMFVPRNDHEKAVRVIREACDTMFKPNTGVILLTDKHRPTQQNIEADRKKFSERYPGFGIEGWDRTCFPSSTGLARVVEGIPDIRVIDFTSCLDRPTPHGATFHIHQEEIPREVMLNPKRLLPIIPGEKPVSEEERRIRSWLVERYGWKNTEFIPEHQEIS